ncbi:hypothetical protein ACPV5C_25535 [Vibrio owensii]|uniref:hypothetical protein n=2 Tax=Vibrio owensii TaxID=696485 RepID=UPI0040686042
MLMTSFLGRVTRPTNLFSQRDADDTHYSFNTTLYGDPNLSVIGSDLYVTNRTDLDGQVKVEYVQRKLNDKGYAGVVELSSRDCGYNNLANFEFHRVILKDGVPTAIGSVYKTKRNGADVYAVVIPLEKGFPCQFYPLTESKKKVPIVQFTALAKNKINYIVDTNKVSARVWNKIILPKGMHPAYFGVPSGLSAQSDLLRK